jgi:hypothetical protein
MELSVRTLFQDSFVYLRGLVYGKEILPSACMKILEAYGYRRRRIFGHEDMGFNEGLYSDFASWLSDKIRNIDSEKIAIGNKTIDIFKSYMVSIDTILALVSSFPHSRIGGFSLIRRVGSDNDMFSVALVPYYGC